MLIGLTYDLRSQYLAEGFDELQTAEFDRDDTVEALETALTTLGFEVDRVGHVRDLVQRLSSGSRWDLVFNIAEGMQGYGREAQVPSLLDAFGIPYTFSDPLALALALHKAMAKRVVRLAGLPTPDFRVVETEDDLARPTTLPYPLFAKPVAEGTGKGITARSRLNDDAERVTVCRRLLREFRQPVLVERFLPGRELTVGVVGAGKDAEALGVLEVALRRDAEPDAYSYENKERCEDLVEYRLVDDPEAGEAARVALAAWRALGCQDGGRVDLRSDADGCPHFLEVNPLAGLHPEHSDLPILARLAGIGYVDLIARIMNAALTRIGLRPPVALTVAAAAP